MIRTFIGLDKYERQSTNKQANRGLLGIKYGNFIRESPYIKICTLAELIREDFGVEVQN